MLISKKIEENSVKNLLITMKVLIGKFLANDIYDKDQWNNIL